MTQDSFIRVRARACRLAGAIAVWALTCVASGVAQAEPAATTAEQYARLPAIAHVSVSPNGKRMAMIVGGDDGRLRLGVIDLDPLGKARIVAGFTDIDVHGAQWVNDERLVFEARPPIGEEDTADFGTFAVDQDGGNLRLLMTPRDAVIRTLWSGNSKVLTGSWWLDSTIDDGGNEVVAAKLVRDTIGEPQGVQLARLDTSTGNVHAMSAGIPDHTYTWLLDSQHRPRMLTARNAGRHLIYWRPGDDGPWNQVADFDPLHESGLSPWFVDSDQQLLVTARRSGDMNALYKFDPLTKRVDTDAVLALKDFDLHPVHIIDTRTGKLVGVRFVTDRPQTFWFDAGLQRVQKGVDAALPPGRNNSLLCGRCESARFVVVLSASDRQPGEYFLFDRADSSLRRIGYSRPWIDESTQGHRSMHRIATRDGLQIPVYVTEPAGASPDKRLPAVVLVHGGPWVRGSDVEWSSEAQFLASRGYRVLEPEFRGSTGYGWKLYQAGWKQWGQAMETDLADTVAWAAKDGLVDASRVCIMGTSYGGYAALMGPIVSPGVYRCAISLSGVTDINLMYDVIWSDLSEENRQFSMPVMVGDQKTDADMLARASPLKRASEIKIPLLVAHGGRDVRVPLIHEHQFVSAARSAGVSVEELFYLQEGHGLSKPVDEADYLTHVEKFLAANLKESAKP